MNQQPFPFQPQMMSPPQDQILTAIQRELHEINKKLEILIKQKQKSYLQDDDNLYML